MQWHSRLRGQEFLPSSWCCVYMHRHIHIVVASTKMFTRKCICTQRSTAFTKHGGRRRAPRAFSPGSPSSFHVHGVCVTGRRYPGHTHARTLSGRARHHNLLLLIWHRGRKACQKLSLQRRGARQCEGRDVDCAAVVSRVKLTLCSVNRTGTVSATIRAWMTGSRRTLARTHAREQIT